VGTDKVFGQDTTSVVILARSGSEPQEASGTKTEVSAAIISRIAFELNAVSPRA
jgi:phosphopantothenoylcysteine decarboxylase/phosphopantothenate--cysteine ligase